MGRYHIQIAYSVCYATGEGETMHYRAAAEHRRPAKRLN